MDQLELIQSKIYEIRGQRVMLDRDLAELFGISSWGRTRKLPYAFTEQGLAMLSGVLNSDSHAGEH